MTERHIGAVEQLAAVASRDPKVMNALLRATEELMPAIRRLDKALAKLQEEPGELGQSITRTLVLRRAMDNTLAMACTTYQKGKT